MNPIQILAERIEKRFPSAKVVLDAPEAPKGPWFLDVTVDGFPLVVEWREGRGFGITAKREPGYGEGADEVIPDVEAASRRIVSLLLSRTPTSPPR